MSKKMLTLEELYNLPLSDIILVAVDDIEAAKKRGDTIRMLVWGWRNKYNCVCCFAGGSLLQYTDRVWTFMEENSFAHAIGHALNNIRRGYVEGALQELSKKLTHEQYKSIDVLKDALANSGTWFHITQYSKKFDDFLIHMTWIALELKAIDL